MGLDRPTSVAFEPPATPVGKIGDAKSKNLGDLLSLTDKVVTAVFVDEGVKSFYIEEDDRSSGIKVYPNGDPTVLPGDRVSVVGTLYEDANGELCLNGASVNVTANGQTVPSPLGQNNKALLEGLDNTGLLVKCWGSVKRIEPPYFWIDDGTNYSESELSGPGVRVMGTCPVSLPGGYVQVTGIHSKLNVGGNPVPLLRMRSPADAAQVDQPES